MSPQLEDSYDHLRQTDLTLSDQLAIDRTLMANERTLLAYLRSAVALVIAGVTMIHFAESGWFSYVGAACIPLGFATGFIGVIRYQQFRTIMGRIRKQLLKKL